VQQVAHEPEFARANQREQKRRRVVVGQSRALPMELLRLQRSVGLIEFAS
jgi:hypothetical protein